jgi:K+-sensing histidine kinase KdpD
MSEQQTSPAEIRLNICDLISETVAELQQNSKGMGVDISYARMNRNYVVFAGRDKLFSIVMTLMQNAVQFAGPGGTVDIEHERIKGKRHNDRSDFIKIGLRICGPGVSRNMFDVVIDKFQNISNLLSEKPSGKTSLVLAATQKSIFQLGGNIWIKSELGRGLTFFFTIPIQKQCKKKSDTQSRSVTVVNG